MKKSNPARPWLLATVGIVLVIFIAAWFLLVNPMLAQASETNQAAEDQEAMNDITRIEVADLRAKYAKIDEYNATLAQLQEGITTRQRYADLQRLVAAVTEEHDVLVTALQFTSAAPVTLPAPAAPAPVEDVEDVESEDADAEDATVEEPAAAPAAVSVEGLYAITVTLRMEGAYHDLLAVADDLQTGDGRIILVKQVSLAALTGEDVDEDAASLTMEGETYVLIDPAELNAAAEEVLDEEPSESTSLPTTDENPLTPVDR
ncbi:hypothetical protein [uncultured Demequina sp.]|uniref:hypothetical protein n=1 Tax=uncultured Demequina sp. TaxID=693499 RepID=UPI0025E743BA|nr:hypothetical protein [uncultured Demequina sp.]